VERMRGLIDDSRMERTNNWEMRRNEVRSGYGVMMFQKRKTGMLEADEDIVFVVQVQHYDGFQIKPIYTFDELDQRATKHNI